MKHLKNSYVFFSLSLLFLFAGCSLMLVYAQIKGYQDLESSIQQSAHSHTPAAYLINKVHSYDKKGAVSIVTVEGIECLKLQDEQTDTYIYVKDGSLQELYTVQNIIPDLGSGQKLMDCASLSFVLEPPLLKIQLENQMVQIRLHSEVRV